MAWNMKDYPDSMKNFSELERKKAIDIANALLVDGYEEEQAIPIAISQMKKWFEDVDGEKIKTLKNEPNPKKSDKHENDSNFDLLDNDVEVRPVEFGWEVKTVDAKRAANIFATKEEALERAREIARNKETSIRIFSLEDKHQRDVKPRQ